MGVHNNTYAQVLGYLSVERMQIDLNFVIVKAISEGLPQTQAFLFCFCYIETCDLFRIRYIFELSPAANEKNL